MKNGLWTERNIGCLLYTSSLRLHGLSAIHWKTTPAGGHLALFALDARCLGMVMTETYWVEDGKIRFESSICRGGMQETIQNL